MGLFLRISFTAETSPLDTAEYNFRSIKRNKEGRKERLGQRMSKVLRKKKKKEEERSAAKVASEDR